MTVSSIHFTPPSFLYLSTNALIFGNSSGIRNGLLITSSTPASRVEEICSALAFAVTAITGTCLTKLPSPSNSRIRRVQLSPSMTGISISINTTSIWILLLLEAEPFQNQDFLRASMASPPWLARWTMQPFWRSCLARTFWLTRLSSTIRTFRGSSAGEEPLACGLLEGTSSVAEKALELRNVELLLGGRGSRGSSVSVRTVDERRTLM